MLVWLKSDNKPYPSQTVLIDVCQCVCCAKGVVMGGKEAEVRVTVELPEHSCRWPESFV